MKSSRNNLWFALIIALTLAVFSTSFASAANKNTPIKKKDIKTLLKTASEPADHLKIAAYYRQEAARLNQSAKEHADLATIYKQNPPNPAMEAKHGSSVEGASHCNRWSELAREQAKEAEALAALHEGMAKDAEKK